MKEKWGYVCQQCGQQHSKWAGRCQECGEWNSIVEERVSAPRGAAKTAARVVAPSSGPQPICDVAALTYSRITSDISELDDVLGGGLVQGSVVLLGGDPGIGKSTLLLQAADQYASLNHKVLYVSGEESASQIALRSERLNAKSKNLLVFSETSLEEILNQIESIQPKILVIDSIQTVYTGQIESQPGSVGQLRECAFQLIGLAKQKGIATFLVGHVTKEGAIAGPKVLEHMVDVVLYFEGASSQSFRLLRSMKNRFGSTNELGVFEMVGHGLKPVTNPSELFLSERPLAIPGSVVVASLEGTRPLLVEVQALASATALSFPRRTAIGLDPNRVSLLVAILEKRGGFRLFDQDVYVNVAGGLRLNEPAADLGVIAALISSYNGKAVAKDSVFFGEVGLGGEVRTVPQVPVRLKEARRIGIKRAYLPKRAASQLEKDEKLEIYPIEHIQDLADKI